MGADITTELALSALAASYGGLVIPAALRWLPFTPSFTGPNSRWMGWQDIPRWFLSGLFLFLAPPLYTGALIAYLNRVGPAITFSPPSARDAAYAVAVVLLSLPVLGLYDIWQSIVRRWPRAFYSTEAVAAIERDFASAFTRGRLNTFLLGLFWLLAPLGLFRVLHYFIP